MGAGDEDMPVKSSKPSSMQETPSIPTTPPYPDWSNSMQAFYGTAATPPFFASTVASPPPHPFLWGSQHPLMPPYGAVPYPAMYPPGGVYAHPNMVATPGNAVGTQSFGNVHGTAEDGKAFEGKERASSKKTKGTAGNQRLVGGKIGDGGKAASGSGNDIGTQSAESESEGSSDSSDDNNQGTPAMKKGSFDQMLADGASAQNNAIPANFETSVPGNPVVSVPTTNLNIGMDLWNASPAGSGAMVLHSAPGASSGMMGDQWVQDERELKKQKRKQSNRESARRSRLRKQAECEELQKRVETLSNENHSLRDEMDRLSEECEKLTSENNSIKEELTRLGGPDSVAKLVNGNSDTHDQPRADEGTG